MNSDANMKAELMRNLKELHLPTIREGYQGLANDAARNGLTHEQYLHELIQRECDDRRQRRVQRMLEDSHLPVDKSFASFRMDRLPPKALRQIRALQDGLFLDRKENVLIFGTPGSGKTHVVAALGQELVRKGHSILFITYQLLIQELLLAKRDLRLAKLFKKYSHYEGMIIDEFGHISEDKLDMEVVFGLIADRYERSSILLTTNLPFSKWETIFMNEITTFAATDRLTHHSTVIELNIPSFRQEEAKANLLAQFELVGSSEDLSIPARREPTVRVNGSGLAGSGS